ncbi:S1_RNA binding domain-containing protein [Hexamita inflata]|uniref:S1 RNA binding domain-containing protein n=1 Tax=Hexamita inflata TaxID=28002 RepID=A0AA86RIC0_9EUKA|nr:S1 RNA binding domain-containing protein [Hexamita inflata]
MQKEHKKPTHQPISFRSLRESSSLLGQITKISPEGLQMQFHSGILGFVPAEFIQGQVPLSERFSAHQWLAAKYITGAPKTIFDVSPGRFLQYPRTGRLLQVVITKEEENGWFCSIKQQNEPQMVLPRSNVTDAQQSKIRTGSILQVKVQKQSGGILTLTMLPTENETKVVPAHLIPGDLVQGAITEVQKVSLVKVSDDSAYDFVLDFQHFRRPTKLTIDHNPYVGFSGQFRVIGIDTNNGNVYLSNLQNLIDLHTPELLRINQLLYKACFEKQVNANVFFDLKVVKAFDNVVYFNVIPEIKLKQFDTEKQLNLLKQLANQTGFNMKDLSDFDDLLQHLNKFFLTHLCFCYTKTLVDHQITSKFKAGEFCNYFFKQAHLLSIENLIQLEPISIHKTDQFERIYELQEEVTEELMQVGSVLPKTFQVTVVSIESRIKLQVMINKLKLNAFMDSVHLPSQYSQSLRVGQDLNKLGLPIRVIGENKLSLLNYGQFFSFTQQPLVGQVARGAVVGQRQLSYQIDFQGVKGVQRCGVNLEVGKCYNFICLSAEKSQFGYIVKQTELECSSEQNQEAVLNETDVLLGFEPNMHKIDIGSEIEAEFVSAHPQAFAMSSNQITYLLPLSLSTKKSVSEFKSKSKYFVSNTQPLLISEQPVQKIKLEDYFYKQLKAVVISGRPEFTLCLVSGTDMKVQLKNSFDQFKQFEEIDIEVYKKSDKYNDTFFGKLVVERTTSSKQNYKAVQMITTQNLNNVQSLEDLLKKKVVKGEPLLKITKKYLNGYLIDLGLGIIGFVSAASFLLKDTDKITIDQIVEKKKEYVINGVTTLIGKQQLSLIELGDYKSAAGTQAGLKLVNLLPAEFNTKLNQNKARVISCNTDHCVFELLTGGFCLLHSCDAAATAKSAIAMMDSFTENQIVELKNIKQLQNPSQYVNALTEGYLLKSILEAFPVYYSKIVDQKQFSFIAEQELVSANQQQFIQAIVSLEQSVKQLNIWRIPDFSVEKLSTFFGFQEYFVVDKQFSLQKQNLPNSITSVSVGDVFIGFVNHHYNPKLNCLYLSVSESVSAMVYLDQLSQQTLSQKDIQNYIMSTPVKFRVIKKLNNFIVGAAHEFALKSTFALRDNLKVQQRHYGRVINIGERSVKVELLDVFPKTYSVVPFANIGQNVNQQQVQLIYKLEQLVHIVIMELKGELVYGSLMPEAFVTAGYDLLELENLNNEKEHDKLLIQKKLRSMRDKVLEETKTEKVVLNRAEKHEQHDQDQELNEEDQEVGEETYEINSLNFEDEASEKQAEKSESEPSEQVQPEIVPEQAVNLDQFEQKDEMTPDDYEKVLIEQPDSSYIWIQYAGYFLGKTEIQNAIQTLTRAVKTIQVGSAEFIIERINCLVAKLQIIKKFNGQEVLQQEIQKQMQTFEAPSMLSRSIVDFLLQVKDYVTCELLFKQLFANKKRKHELKNVQKYIEYLFQSRKYGSTDLAQLIQNCECDSNEKHNLFKQVGISFFEINEFEKGRIVFEDICKTNRLEALLQWISVEEKYSKVETIRDVYQQICNRDFGAKKQKILSVILKKFYEFEKTRGGETLSVQELAKRLE